MEERRAFCIGGIIIVAPVVCIGGNEQYYCPNIIIEWLLTMGGIVRGQLQASKLVCVLHYWMYWSNYWFSPIEDSSRGGVMIVCVNDCVCIVVLWRRGETRECVVWAWLLLIFDQCDLMTVTSEDWPYPYTPRQPPWLVIVIDSIGGPVIVTLCDIPWLMILWWYLIVCV